MKKEKDVRGEGKGREYRMGKGIRGKEKTDWKWCEGRKGKERKGKERKGKERKGKERKGNTDWKRV